MDYHLILLPVCVHLFIPNNILKVINEYFPKIENVLLNFLSTLLNINNFRKNFLIKFVTCSNLFVTFKMFFSQKFANFVGTICFWLCWFFPVSFSNSIFSLIDSLVSNCIKTIKKEHSNWKIKLKWDLCFLV